MKNHIIEVDPTNHIHNSSLYASGPGKSGYKYLYI